MSFANPLALWLFLPLVAVAVWALFRPARQLVVVGSLKLWQQAQQALASTSQRRRRRINIAWLLLAVGAVLAVLAAAGPVFNAQRPARRVALVVAPSAELAGEGAARLREAAGRLLDRLSSDDRVYLVAPASLGLPAEPVSPGQARDLIVRITPLPVPARQMLPELAPPANIQHTYYLLPAGVTAPQGPAVSSVSIPISIGLTMQTAAAAPLGEGKDVQLFVRVGGLHSGAGVSIKVYVPQGAGVVELANKPLPTGATTLLTQLPARDGYLVAAQAGTAPPSPLAMAGLARVDVRRTAVAIVGKPAPLLERFVRINPALQRVDRVEDAQVVLAVGVDPPAGKAALVIDPPTAPANWQRENERGPLLLHDSAVAPDAVTQDLDVARVAVRRVRPFAPVDRAMATDKPLVQMGGLTLILRTADDASPRRVYVAFDMAAANTDFGLNESFVVFLANTMAFLGNQPGGGALNTYETVEPRQAGPAKDWQPLAPAEWSVARPQTMPWPGLYRDPAGTLHGVGIGPLATTDAATQPAEIVSNSVGNVPLPAPEPTGQPLVLWPGLLLLAAASWLAGWWIRAAR